MERLEKLTLSKTMPINLLEGFIWTDDLTMRQVQMLAPYFSVYESPFETQIIKEGEKVEYIGVLYEGSAEVVKENFSGGRKVLSSIRPGKTFGEMGFFDKQPASASIYVKPQSVLLIMTKSDFEALATESPALGLVLVIKILRGMSARLRETSGKLIDLI